MNFDNYEFNLGSFWASAVINGDTSSLTDSEETQLDAFMAEYQAKQPGGHWDGFDESDYQGFSRDEITGLGSDCYKCRYVFPVKAAS